MEKTYKEKVDRYEFIIEVKKDSGDWFYCHVPAYDLIYGAKDEESVRRKGRAMVKSFFNFNDICAKHYINKLKK